MRWIGCLTRYVYIYIYVYMEPVIYQRVRNSNTELKGNRDVDELSNVDYVVTNAHSCQGESQLCIFEDNEAVIKMIIKGETCIQNPQNCT